MRAGLLRERRRFQILGNSLPVDNLPIGSLLRGRDGSIGGGFCFKAYASAREQNHLDAGGDAPAFFALNSESGKGMSKRLAQTQTVKHIECDAVGLSRIDGLGEQLKRTPGNDRSPHGCGRYVRAGAGQHAACGHGPRLGEERLNSGNAHGGAHSFAEGLREQSGIGRKSVDGWTALLRQERDIGRLRRLQEALTALPGQTEEFAALFLYHFVFLNGEWARMLGEIRKHANDSGIKQALQCIVYRL